MYVYYVPAAHRFVWGSEALEDVPAWKGLSNLKRNSSKFAPPFSSEQIDRCVSGWGIAFNILN